jgi:signal transduction histidine kinase
VNLVPAQSLGDVQTLLDDFEHAGLHVEVRRDGTIGDLPPALDLTAHRIVQEGLTNVLRHGGPVARLTITRTDAMVVIEVTDDGRAPASRRAALVGSGHGLTGIRERTALFGGRLAAGSTSDGGFTLRAELPVDATVSTR